ncbi:MAG: hypothetical protein WBV57_08915 [Methanoregula sp.]|uniref:hypothetical protein n=1 Tax=Methanoregula sp. TaxID=2052170 RepID=UPI003C35A931
MEPEIAVQPVATVTGLYRGKFGGLEPLTASTPLTREEVRRNPIFYELDLHPEQADENLIIDVIYDNLSPLRLQDLYRGTDIPRGVRFWPDWFDIPPYASMRDVDGRWVFPRAPGIHTVQIRTGRKTWECWLLAAYPDKVINIVLSQGHTETTALRHYFNISWTQAEREAIKEQVIGWGCTS